MVSETRRKELGNAFVNEGDLLISRSGSVGIVSVVPKEAERFAFGSFMIKFCLNDKIDRDFVSMWLNNKISQLFIKREKIGAIQGNITIETIENLQIPTPPLATQKKLAGEVKERLAQVKKISAEAQEEVEKAKDSVENLIKNQNSYKI
ncbi:MAG: type I restriction enzyme, S subunit [Parcubacteria group bacterium Gr01-1014_24]|nr:MAG: type I restriction enzyme, S subunit [Parcubacteria group bacterium Gr01-1014_24]